MRNYFRIIAVPSMLVVAATGLLSGQTSKGTIAGTVLDPSASVITNATITATDTQGAETRTVKTGAGGEYRIEAITPSIYTITVTAPGFSKKEVNRTNVQASIVTSQNITLEVGGIEQTVSVEAGMTQLQTETGELSTSVS